MPRTTRNPAYPGNKWPEGLKKPHGTAKDKRNGEKIDPAALQSAHEEVLIYTPYDLEGEVKVLWDTYTDAAIGGMPVSVDKTLCCDWANATHHYFRAIQFHRVGPINPDYLDLLLFELNALARKLGVNNELSPLH